MTQTVYESAGGRAGLLKLAGAWHARVLQDEVVSHAFSHGFHPQHTERLAAYWAEALGGPTTYSEQYGDETSVVRIHSGNGPHEEMDQRAIACFDQALEDVGLKRGERLWRVLHDYFAWATTTTMARYHDSADDVPTGLSIPKWSWDGLVGVATTAARELQKALDSQPKPDCAALTPFAVEDVDFDAGRVVLRFASQPAFKNHFGNVQGGFAVAMVDVLVSVAAYAKTKQWLPTIEIKSSFVAALRLGECRGEGLVLRVGRQVAFLEARLWGADGKLAVHATATAAVGSESK